MADIPIGAEIEQTEHKRYEEYLIWLLISCIDFFPPAGRKMRSNDSFA